MSELHQLLKSSLDAVRTGQFTDDLRKNVEFLFSCRQGFREEGDEVSWIRIHSLCCEIYEQTGEYHKALDIVKNIGEEYLMHFGTAQTSQFRPGGVPESELDSNRRVARQKVI